MPYLDGRGATSGRVVRVEGLRLVPVRRASSRIADVTQPIVALQLCQVRLVEHSTSYAKREHPL